MKLDLSYCGLRAAYIHRLNIDDTLISGIHELNLEGNPILQEVCSFTICSNLFFLDSKISRVCFIISIHVYREQTVVIVDVYQTDAQHIDY